MPQTIFPATPSFTHTLTQGPAGQLPSSKFSKTCLDDSYKS